VIWSPPKPPEDPAVRYRRVHSEWLTRALSAGREYPRIPVRRVEVGGFSTLLQRANGWMLAARWWILALARVDD
jgi:hypothetical protein